MDTGLIQINLISKNKILKIFKTLRCGCLKEIILHDLRAKQNPEVKEWTRDSCTVEDDETDACGDMYFQDVHDMPAKVGNQIKIRN